MTPKLELRIGWNDRPATVDQLRAIIENLRAQLLSRDTDVDHLREALKTALLEAMPDDFTEEYRSQIDGLLGTDSPWRHG